jgi:PAS domain S-box-containing protein
MSFAGLRRIGLLSRVSHLIILQGIFVVIAIALVLFYPSREITTKSETAPVSRAVQAAGDDVVAQLDLGNPAPYSSHLYDSLAGVAGIEDACLMQVLDGKLVSLSGTEKGKPRLPENSVPANFGNQLDYDLARIVAAEHPGYLLSNISSSSKAVYYYRPRSSLGKGYLFVALANHNLLISARDEIRYILLMLFLVSMLMSLLIVYVISKRVKEPLAKVARAIEKSAQGESVHETVNVGDEELRELSESANRLSNALWTSREQVTEVSNRLVELNQSLAQSRLFLSALIDSSPLCIMVSDLSGRILIFNQEASAIFEIDRTAALTRNVNDLLYLTAHQNEEITAVDHEFEAVGRKGTGETFPLYMITSPLQDSQGKTWARLFIARDITESKSFQEMMIRLDRYSTRGEMAGEIAHEINNYLAVLGGNVELLPILLRKGDQEKIAKKLDLMKNTVDRIAKFTDGLMDSGDEQLRLDPCNLNQVIENVIAFLKPQNKFDAIEISALLAMDIPLARADSGQLQQLLVNIVNNAADAFAGHPDKGHLTITTSCPSGRERPCVRMEISDNGPGVPEDKIPLLFDKRFTTKRRGHGIGLVTCRKIADAHQGRIGYEFRDGAMFWVEIPLEPVAEVRDPETTQGVPIVAE